MDFEAESSEVNWYGSLTSEQVSRLQLLYLFPRNYEFHSDEVIQLWMAQDLVPLPASADMEFCARSYFKEFEEHGVFQLSTLDYSVGQQRYKLSNSFVDLLAQNRTDEFFRVDDLNSHVSENTKHASLRDDSIDAVTLPELYKAERLATLLIVHQRGTHLDQLPHDLFLNLPLLRVLDLSHTSLTELPSFIGNLNDLRYLNLSYTPITALPKSLCTLYKMQTLKLKGCLKLVDLPKGMRKLINLRHLEVDLDCLLVSMPLGLGDLVELRTLPAFVVGKENGCHITELRNMKNLFRTLSILRLQNVSSSVEAEESALENKIHLQTVELHWTDCVDGLEVLENLQPHTELEALQIVGYGGAKFPNWIGEPIFSKLATITICDCRNCEMLPPVGKLPSLQHLSISDMQAVKTINSSFCGKNMVAGLLGSKTLILNHFRPDDHHMFKAFQSLEKLTLNRMLMLETWSGIEEGDFPNLRKLYISHCPKLTSLPELSLIISLQQLEITLCPLLESFPNKGLPTSLQCLVIIDCPQLKVLSHKDERQDLGELGRIPNVWIDYQQIIQASPSPTTGNSALPSQNFEPNVRVLSDSYMEKDNRAGADSLIMLKPHESPGKRLASSSPTGRSSLPYQNVKPKVGVPSDTDMEKGNRAGVDSLIIIEPHGGPEKKLASPSLTIGNSPLPSQSFKPNVQVLSGTDMEKENRAGGDSLIMIKPHGSPGKRLASAEVDFFTEYGEWNRYRIEEVIGKGDYGVVCSAYDTNTGEKVAIKKINNIFEHLSDATRMLREIKLLRLLRHPDIVEIKHILLPPSRREFKDIYVVFELMESDLDQVIKANDDLTLEHYQFFLYQLLRGLKYIHTANVFHRDLKPKNILANANCKLKICDFGQAGVAFNDTPTTLFWTDYVATSWYRAPELCGSFFSKYTPAIDIWSIGCIFAEILTGKPLFPGKSVVHQLDLMTDMLGTPSAEAIARVRNEAARRYLSSMRKKKPIPFSQKFPNADPLALRLLERMLALEPKDRPTAEEALADPYFRGLAKVEREPSAQPMTKMEFEFDRRRITKEDVRELIYREILEYHPMMLKKFLEGTGPIGFMYPSAVDQFKKQFAFLEEQDGNGATAVPLERQHASLPRQRVLYSDNVVQNSFKVTDNLAKCCINDSDKAPPDRNDGIPMARGPLQFPQRAQGAAAKPEKVVGSVLPYNKGGTTAEVYQQ